MASFIFVNFYWPIFVSGTDLYSATHLVVLLLVVRKKSKAVSFQIVSG